jgi:hypothetical protein
MKIKELIDFLQDKIKKEDFLIPLQTEVKEYIHDRLKKDTSHIYVSDLDDTYKIDNTDLIKLLSFYLKEDLYEWDIEYLLNGLDLVEVESSTKAQEVIFILSTPEINYFIDQVVIKKCIDYLEGETNKLNLESAKTNRSLTNYRTVFSCGVQGCLKPSAFKDSSKPVVVTSVG